MGHRSPLPRQATPPILAHLTAVPDTIRSILALTFVAIGAACSETSAPEAVRRLAIVSGADATDTAAAVLGAPLIIEVRDSSGTPMPGVVVELEGAAVEGASMPGIRQAYLSRILGPGQLPSFDPGTLISDTTDAAGRVQVRVTLGTRAGGATVRIRVPSQDLETAATYTIRPASKVGVAVFPGDTALYVDASYELRGGVVDQFGNAHPDPVTWSTQSSAISLTGRTIRGQAIGRGHVVASSGSWTGTGYVSVVPAGTIATHLMRAYDGDEIGIGLVNLDGSGFRRIVTESKPGNYGGGEPGAREMNPAWAPSGDRLFYHEGGLAIDRLRTTDLAGNHAAIGPTLNAAYNASASRDGQWVYFAALLPEQPSAIWRMRPDGSSPEALPLAEDFNGEREDFPAPSPDGLRIAYTSQTDGGNIQRLRVRTIATGVRTALDVQGVTPRWSPAGDYLAYVETWGYSGYYGALRVIRPDGTGGRRLAPDTRYTWGIDWSPDGKYIIARAEGTHLLELVDVATGARLPLGYSYRMLSPAWRPTTP